MEKIIAEILKDLYVPQSILGYAYLKTAIMLCLDDPEAINAITKGLYPAVASAHNTTPTRAIAAIKYAVEISCLSAPDHVIGYYIASAYEDSVISASRYMAAIAEHIRTYGDDE